jgi:hypothetical protein
LTHYADISVLDSSPILARRVLRNEAESVGLIGPCSPYIPKLLVFDHTGSGQNPILRMDAK